MQLSKRLKMTAGCVSTGSVTADIGCDHAYLPIYLVRQGISGKVIAMDINKGPLHAAKSNIMKYHLEDKIELRLSDGLMKLLPYEADTIVIAGMGGDRIVSILNNGLSCIGTVRELVLAPQSEEYKVRRFLEEYGFHTIYEDMCFDAGQYYKVIKAENTAIPAIASSDSGTRNIRGGGLRGRLSEVEEAYGGYLLAHRHPLLKELLLKQLSKNCKIQETLFGKQSEKAAARLSECIREERLLQGALQYYQ